MNPPTLTHIDLGDACRVVVKLRNPATDNLEDGTVTVTATGPSSTATVVVNKLAAGTYEAVFTPDTSGSWTVAVAVSGSKSAMEYGVVRVRAAP
jgi:hypothetical protein